MASSMETKKISTRKVRRPKANKKTANLPPEPSFYEVRLMQVAIALRGVPEHRLTLEVIKQIISNNLHYTYNPAPPEGKLLLPALKRVLKRSGFTTELDWANVYKR